MRAHCHRVYAVKMKKKSIYISIVCSSSLGSACMEVRLRVVPAYQVKPASHFASQSFSFLLPFGLAIGAFMPAIFALYFARRGPFVAHLKVHQEISPESAYMLSLLKRPR